MAVTILHISDLHRDPLHPVTNGALIDSLVRDRGRHGDRRPALRSIDLIVVSGDIVLGVDPTAEDATTSLVTQYDEASAFLSRLADELVDGDHERVVIVPGNHDISEVHFRASLKPVRRPVDGPMSARHGQRHQILVGVLPLRWKASADDRWRLARGDRRRGAGAGARDQGAGWDGYDHMGLAVLCGPGMVDLDEKHATTKRSNTGSELKVLRVPGMKAGQPERCLIWKLTPWAAV